MSLKNFNRIDVEPTAKQKMEDHFASFTQPTDICRHCGQPDRFGSCYNSVCWTCRQNCEHELVITGYIVKANGGHQVKRLCFHCGRGQIRRLGPPRRGDSYYDICLEDNRDGTVCERCGEIEGVELHHYAPRNTFDDAHRWGTGYLCVPCHHEWHRTMSGYQWQTKRASA